jgi:hypothetical protein
VSALAILVLITIVTLVTGKVAITELEIAANEQRARQAFEAAQAGMEYAVAYMEDDGTDHDDDGNVDTITDPNDPVSLANGSAYAVEFCAKPLVLPATTSVAPSCNPATDISNVLVYARGWSDDRTAQQHIIQVIEKIPAIANPPANPLTVQGTSDINGAGQVTNPEGNMTIWSGDTVDFNSATFNTAIPNPSGSGLIETSNMNHLGVDIVQDDPNLSTLTPDQYFRNFFGVTPADYRDYYATTVVPGADFGTVAGTIGEVIWVDGDIPVNQFGGNTVLGTATQPVVLIVDGNMTTSGTVTVNGLVFVFGDLASGTGNVEINGAVIVAGNTLVTGTLDIVYDSAILANTNNVSSPAAVSGSWRDWL